MFPPCKKILQCFCVLLFLQNIIFADEFFHTPDNDKFLKTVYTTDNGLPQNTPKSLVQTKDGYIWIATFGGLARFDGLKFTVFTTTSAPQLNSNRLTCLYEDQTGVLWIGSEEGDLTSYQNGGFTSIKKSEGPPTDNTILSMFRDKNGVLWIGTSLGLKTYNPQNGQFTNIDLKTILKSDAEKYESKRISEFCYDSEGNLWIVTARAGLIRFRDGVFTNFNTDDGLPGNALISIKNNPKGGLWILTTDEFGKYENGRFLLLGKADNSSPLVINAENHIFYTYQKTLYEFDENGKEVAKHDLNDVVKSVISSMLFNTEGDLLIGDDYGLIHLKKRYITVFSNTSSARWHPTTAIIEDLDKNVWISGLDKLIRWKAGRFDIFSPLVTAVQNGQVINSLAVDVDGSLWIGSLGQLIKYKDGKFSKIENPLIVKSIGALLPSQQGLWIGSKTNGLQLFQNETIKNFTTDEGLTNNSISRIMQARNGEMWIGTKSGLNHLVNSQISNESNLDVLKDKYIRDIYEDQNGTFWIGTYGSGIFRLKDGKIVAITSENGLAENIVSRILVDDADNFWIMGNQGIYSVSRQSLEDFADGKIKRVYCAVYGKVDGMEVSEGNGGNQPAGWKTSDGRLWFPMIRGGITIDPSIQKSKPPPVYIEEASLNKQKIDVKNKVEIQPDQSNLEINYTGINFTKPEQIQFRYKLDGYDIDWQDVGTRRIAYYAYLPPGTYTFKVLAINTSGIISEKEASLEIIVHAPFWRTWWFYTLIFLALSFLMFLAYRSRLRIIENKRRQQEDFSRQLISAHESERSRIAGELHDSLGQNLLIIKNWTLLILKKLPSQDENRKQLEEISEFASQSLDETRNIARNLRPQHLQKFGLTSTIEYIIRQVKESTEIKFQTEIENIDNLFSSEAELSIFRIIQESLNNVIKHSNAKNAKIVVRQIAGKIDLTNTNDKVEILISDDGKGFDLNANNKTSFGLNNISQRVGLLGGKYSIKSSVGQGTQITILLNLN
ncbi:MAG TPA: two-component regulator propeller domain-containing protein [Pyrinomonadaceae bacterium]|nr:two-component regulator propeller domain-containing protein [Pyrinomonadaceae bacterium]